MEIAERNLSFLNTNNTIKKLSQLNEKYEMAETHPGFKGIQLYPHQQTIVRAILDIENKRMLSFDKHNKTDYTADPIVIDTSALVLSEPFGSGKTIVILAVILERPIPRAVPTYANSIVLEPTYPRHSGLRELSKKAFKCEIIKRFTGRDALISPNLIVVGSSVLIQWENAIHEFTNLRVFTIANFYSLQKFCKLYKAKKLGAFDIILLKNGTVTGNFIVPGESPDTRKDYRSLVNVVSKVTSGSCWSRVIYDDFDTIRIPVDATAIDALFTIYVSATTKTVTPARIRPVEYENIYQLLSSRNTLLNSVTRDKLLFTNFNIRNENEFVELSTNIPRAEKYKYIFVNPDDNYIRLLGAMGEEDAKNIMEMLNGDAVATAAETLGLKSTSVADIFQRVLDKKYEQFMRVVHVLENIDNTCIQIHTLEPHPEDKVHNNGELDIIRTAITKNTTPNCKYYSPALDRLMDDLRAEYTLLKEQNGLAIQRVIDNIREGMCQICALPLESFDTFIVRCCGLIVCDVCGIKGNQIQRRHNYKLKTDTIYGACANCKTTIYLDRDLIFVDKNFDMASLLQAKGDEKPAEPLIEPEVIVAPDAALAPPADEFDVKNPKLKALLQIIKGVEPEGKERFYTKTRQMLEGRVDKPRAEGTPRKVIVFASFNETLNNIEKCLTAHGIDYLRIGGTHNEKAATVKKFRTQGTVLIINSQQDCAGLNIEVATDTVIFHAILDENVEAQVLGRAQRMGRTCNLHIHYLCYKNEKDRV